MSEKPPETPKIPPPKINQQPQPDQLMILGQAHNQLFQKVNILEVEVMKANAHIEILNKTLELIEKRMDFNEKKNS